ncbi:MAG TPA: cellulase family glycosylhydrolase [Candidatus Saccharimonadales bacterium]|nr:cellulase family glycosylhydrolase [Candidatus Saccharimonadales bacterium]
MSKRLPKKVGVLVHEIFIVCCALFVVGYMMVSFLITTAQTGKDVIAPVVVRPQVTTPSLPPLQPNSFGMSMGDVLRTLPQEELSAQLKDIKSLGFNWVRTDIDWSAVQRQNATNYDWSAYDRVVETAHANGLGILGVIAYAPAWARLPECVGSDKCRPASNTAYAAFAKAVVQRYSAKGVKTWEIWNEPNIQGFWRPAPNAQIYTAMLKAAYTAIKSVDPTATVLSGGLSPAEDQPPGHIAPRDFLKAMYANGAQGSFDAFAHHPYSYPAPPNVTYSWSSWSQMASLSPSLRSIMDANGDGNKQIWITEVGSPTGGAGATATPANFRLNLSATHGSEDLQSVFVEQTVAAVNSYPWAGPMFWYSYKDLGSARGDNENFFGIIRSNGTKKPAYETFKRVLAK